MPVHPETQVALDAAHAALDAVRLQLRLISDQADQSGTIDALEALAESIADVPMPVAPPATATAKPAATPKKKKAKSRR